MDGIFDRCELLFGHEMMERIAEKRVILVGTGGVGSWCAESLVRTGIHHLTIVDSDSVCESNINRQLMATVSTIGRPKVEALRERLLDINPHAEITAIQDVYSKENSERFHLDSYDYIIDCIDSLKHKIDLILEGASVPGARVFSSMGAALKMDPTRVRVADFWDVRGCPLGAAMRKRMRQNGWKPARKVKCVYSEELLPNKTETGVNGSLMQVTAVFGLNLASLVIQDIVNRETTDRQ